MKVYVDTNFLVRRYLELPGCEEALKLTKGVRRAGPYPITRVLRFESSLTLEDIEPEYEALVARYTAKHGLRTYDVMHVALARAMNCTKFLTFDQKVKSLAKLVGWKTN